MLEFTISLAGKNIGVEVAFETTRDFCKDYLTDEPADFHILVDVKDVRYEHDKAKKEDELEGIPRRYFTPPYLETLALYRKIADRLLDYDTLLFHGSVVSVDGEGYLFTALSGTGKSTHTKLWRDAFGDRAIMINDDKPLLKVTEDQVLVCGTPWDGKHNLSTNTIVPLKGICVLTRAEENHIEPITPSQALPDLLQQSHRPMDPMAMVKLMQLLNKLSERTGLYRLGCNMEPEAALVAYRGMNRKENEV